ncbi:unnamed protein product [Sphagnum balticum]
MGEQHEPFWRKVIKKSISGDISQKTILDVGCGCGGFLKVLYQEKPFKLGYGIDLAEKPIAIANRHRGSLPINYFVKGDEPNLAGKIDLAFSYEVIYLMPDLIEHSQFIYDSLKEDGVYYATTGCHTANPLWSTWKSLVETKSALAVPEYSPEDYCNAFEQTGFTVKAQQLNFDGFVPLSWHPEYFPTALDSINYYKRDTIIFQFAKSASRTSKN